MEKSPTIRDLAKLTGYAKSTVSLALRDDTRLAVDTRRRIQRAATYAGYRLNPVVAHLMAQLRAGREQGYKSTLALLCSTSKPIEFERPGAFHTWIGSCERRARELGYRIDRFWLQEPGFDPASLFGILRTRNISGVLLVNGHDVTKLPFALETIWKSYSCIVVGNHIADPPLNFVCNDQYFTTLETVRKLAAGGCKRPGLVMCEDLDRLLSYKFSAGFQKGHELFIGGRMIPVIEPGRHGIDEFDSWWRKYRPEVIIAINPWPIQWAKQLKRRINLVSIDRNPFMMKWPGMDQNNEAVGAAAVEQLISQIHRNECGIPPVVKCVLIQSTWHDKGG